MNAHRHKLIQLKSLFIAEFGTAERLCEEQNPQYYLGFRDAIDMCLQQVSNALREADKEE